MINRFSVSSDYAVFTVNCWYCSDCDKNFVLGEVELYDEGDF